MNLTRPRLREFLLKDVSVRISGIAALIFVLVAATAWQFLPPPLPEVVRLGTGPMGGHYARVGEVLRREVADRGIRLELVSSAGSRENVQRLLAGTIDVGLVQGGNLSDEEAARLASVAALFLEPVLIVSRADWEADHVEGGRIAIGVRGSGTNTLAIELLADQGVADGVPTGTEFVEIGGATAVEALRSGEIDSAIFVTSLDVPWVHTLFADRELRVVRFELAEAFTRYYRYLRRIVIPAGLLDLQSEIPSDDVPVIATTASLVIRPDVHSAVVPLLIESARARLSENDLLAKSGEFPSPHGVEAPLKEDALVFFERGPSFLYRWLPFSYAFAATRFMVLLIPLLTLLYPVFRSVGPTYRWVIERRVYRWYRILRMLEDRMDVVSDTAKLKAIRRELEEVGEEIRSTHVPPRYGASLFALRIHHNLLVDRLAGLVERHHGA